MRTLLERFIRVGGVIGAVLAFGRIGDWSISHLFGVELEWGQWLPAALQGAAAVVTSRPVATILLLCAGAWINVAIDAFAYRREGTPGGIGARHLRARLAWTGWVIGSRFWTDEGRRAGEIDRMNRILDTNGFETIPAGARHRGSEPAERSLEQLKAQSALIKALGVEKAASIGLGIAETREPPAEQG